MNCRLFLTSELHVHQHLQMTSDRRVLYLRVDICPRFVSLTTMANDREAIPDANAVRFGP